MKVCQNEGTHVLDAIFKFGVLLEAWNYKEPGN